MEVRASAVGKGKKETNVDLKGRNKTYFFTDDMTACVENPKDSTSQKKLLDLISEISRFAGYKNQYIKNQPYSCTLLTNN